VCHGHQNSQVMHRQYPTPFFIEIVADETSVTVTRCGFRTQKTCTVEHLGLEMFLDFSAAGSALPAKNWLTQAGGELRQRNAI
jgi:hypothetical protein